MVLFKGHPCSHDQLGDEEGPCAPPEFLQFYNPAWHRAGTQ